MQAHQKQRAFRFTAGRRLRHGAAAVVLGCLTLVANGQCRPAG